MHLRWHAAAQAAVTCDLGQRVYFSALFLVCGLSTSAYAQEPAAPDAGMTQIAPGLWAVPSESAPMWFTEGQYYVCTTGQWSTTVGGAADWSPVAAQLLPDSVRDGLDAGRYATYSVCPGDPLPPAVATAIGGPSVIYVAGYPRILRVGPFFRGWRPAPVWSRQRFSARSLLWPAWNRPTFGGGFMGGYRGGHGWSGVHGRR